MSSANRIMRIHGPYVSEKEIEKITSLLRAQGEPDYIEEITFANEASFDSLDAGDEDELFKSWDLIVGKKIILLPGRLTSWKGQEMFLEALSKVNIQLGNDSFIAVILGNDQGRDLYRKKLIRLVEQYRLTKQIRFIDHCKNMPLAYKISDIVVSTSIEPEAFGRVAVEAQSMQKIILASNIGGSNETVIDGKSGILFEAGNSDDLSKKIIQVMNFDPNELSKMGNFGRENAVKKFNVEKMCFSTYSEYKKLFN